MSQHLEALELANRVRHDAANVRRELAAGTLTVEDALDDPRAGSLTAEKMLASHVRWGTQRVRHLLSPTSILPYVRVRDLTHLQRYELAAAWEEATQGSAAVAAKMWTSTSRAGDAVNVPAHDTEAEAPC